jgi:protein-S-isoprenylcysteine O-methyltransferase Ste14
MPWFTHARAFDLLWAMPLIFANGLAVYVLGQRLIAGFEALRAERFPLLQATAVLTQTLTIIYLCLMVVVFFVRRLPVAKAGGIQARLVAVIASNFEIVILVLPHADCSPARDFISSVLQAVGLAGAIYVLSILGRSFSILPQARGLVTRGPYRFVRHPLYLAGMIAELGIMLQFIQPWAVLITVSGFVLQLIRLNFEERILAHCYPEYESYAANTARLLPGIY